MGFFVSTLLRLVFAPRALCLACLVLLVTKAPQRKPTKGHRDARKEPVTNLAPAFCASPTASTKSSTVLMVRPCTSVITSPQGKEVRGAVPVLAQSRPEDAAPNPLPDNPKGGRPP